MKHHLHNDRVVKFGRTPESYLLQHLQQNHLQEASQDHIQRAFQYITSFVPIPSFPVSR